MNIKLTSTQQMILHGVIVFLVAAGAVFAKTGSNGVGWSLVAGAGAAGISAVVHWATGLLPNSSKSR